MRWKTKPLPKEGKLYIREYFAFLPVTIDNETRWLEFVKIEGHYINGLGYNDFTWFNRKFLK